MTTSAAIYVRQSLDATGDGLATARQEALCRDLAATKGWTVVHVYRDNDTSSKAGVERPGHAALVRDYEAGRFNALACYDLDRLTRVPRELEDWIDRAERTGLLLITANGEADLTNDGGRMYARIKAAVARAEVERKGARQKAANSQRVLSGEVYGRKPTVGWHDLACKEPDEAVHARIRRAIADVLAGAPLTSIAAQWNEERWFTPTGKPWTHTTARQFILRPVNFGLVTYKDEEHREVEAKWVPVSDVATYDALRVELSSRRDAFHTTLTTRTFLLGGGLLMCAKCGSRMSGATQKSGVNYMCSGRAHGCFRAVRAEVADRVALDWTAYCLLRARPEDYLPGSHVARMQEIAHDLEGLARERQEVAEATLAVAGKVALLQVIDGREAALREEVARLTRDSAIADLVRELTEPASTGGMEDYVLALMAQKDLILERLRALPLRQQRFLIRQFGTFEVHDRNDPQRVRRIGGQELTDPWA